MRNDGSARGLLGRGAVTRVDATVNSLAGCSPCRANARKTDTSRRGQKVRASVSRYKYVCPITSMHSRRCRAIMDSNGGLLPLLLKRHATYSGEGSRSRANTMGGNILLKVPGWRCGTAGVALCHFRPPLRVNSFLPPFLGAAKPAPSTFSWAHPQTLFLVAGTFWPLPPPPHRTVFGFSSSWSLCKEGTLWPVDVPYSN